MNEPRTPVASEGIGIPADVSSALFAQLVMQQANMAMMLLGKVTHPQSGEVIKDIEAARLFIDQLEMLETKTKGNLTKEESALLKQSLMSLRLAFVEAVESPQPQGKPTAEEMGQPPPSGEGADTPKRESTPESTPAPDDEHRKKFSKKY